VAVGRECSIKRNLVVAAFQEQCEFSADLLFLIIFGRLRSMMNPAIQKINEKLDSLESLSVFGFPWPE
jgi:hypothetical protein